MTSRRKAQSKHQQAATMRACGFTWQAIADQLGYRTRSGAQLAVERLYAREGKEPTEFGRRSLNDGLNFVKTVVTDGLASAHSQGDLSAVSRLSREFRNITAEQARLGGLHAPEQVNVEVTVKRPLAEILAETRERLMIEIDERRQRGQLAVIEGEVIE